MKLFAWIERAPPTCWLIDHFWWKTGAYMYIQEDGLIKSEGILFILWFVKSNQAVISNKSIITNAAQGQQIHWGEGHSMPCSW